jgi:hypothetical protein
MLINEALDKSGGEFFSVFESLGEHKASLLFPFAVNRSDGFVGCAVIVKNSCHNHLPFEKVL